MADNVDITPGAGATVAADLVASALHQRVKLSLGADGVAADAPVGGGVEANVLRVTIASDSTGVLSVDDNGSSLTVDGAVKTAESARAMGHAKVALAASQGGTTVLDPTGGKKFVLKKLIVSCKTSGDVYFFDDTDDSAHAIGPALTLAVGGGWTETWDADDLYRSETADHVLKYTSSSGFTGSVYLDYFEE